jgi:D-alanyl-D-alanine carboxypeptidase
VTDSGTAVATLDDEGRLMSVRADGSSGLFSIYSVTKLVVATQVLQLVAAGEVRLDETVGRWEPEAPGASDITLEHLLRHTSGLPDYGGEADYRDDVARGAEPWPEERYLELARRRGLLFAPGQGWSYSNIGYLLLRRLVSSVRAEPWPAAVTATVLQPLGLSRTRALTTREDLAALVPSGDVAERYHPAWVAHGLLASTATELAQLVAGCLVDGGHRVLPPGAVRHEPLHELGLPGRPLHPRPAYGRGVMGGTPDGLDVLGHTGGGPGWTAAGYVVRDAAGGRRAVACVTTSEDQTVPEAEVLRLAARGTVSAR